MCSSEAPASYLTLLPLPQLFSSHTSLLFLSRTLQVRGDLNAFPQALPSAWNTLVASGVSSNITSPETQAPNLN